MSAETDENRPLRPGKHPEPPPTDPPPKENILLNWLIMLIAGTVLVFGAMAVAEYL